MRDARALVLVSALGLLAAAAPAAGDMIFGDGFEECALGRWSSGTFAGLPEQLSGLTPALLAEALGACPPSLASAEFRLADGSVPGAPALAEMADFQSAIFQGFGTGGLTATAGGAMVALSSGRARDEDSPGFVSPEDGEVWGRSTTGPEPFMSVHNNAFPGADGCPNGPNEAHDAVVLRLTFTVPPGAARLAFDWRYLSADYPEWLCTSFVDFFLAVVIEGGSPSLPLDRNVALDGTGLPVSGNSPDLIFCSGCPGGTGPLAGTGYGASAASDWHPAFVPVVPGETLVLDLAAFDVGDGQTDELVLLDGLRWLAD
jgi:hypothetical protein